MNNALNPAKQNKRSVVLLFLFLLPVTEYRDLVSASTPIFMSLALEGCRSRSRAYFLKNLNDAPMLFGETSVFQTLHCLSSYLRQRQAKQCQKSDKITVGRWWWHFLEIQEKLWRSRQMMKVRVSVLAFLTLGLF